jgi:hypothetical protein
MPLRFVKYFFLFILKTDLGGFNVDFVIALFIVMLGFFILEIFIGVSIVFKFDADDQTWIAGTGGVCLILMLMAYILFS